MEGLCIYVYAVKSGRCKLTVVVKLQLIIDIRVLVSFRFSGCASVRIPRLCPVPASMHRHRTRTAATVYFIGMSHISPSHCVNSLVISLLVLDIAIAIYPIGQLRCRLHTRLWIQDFSRDRLGVLWRQAKVTTYLLPIPIPFSSLNRDIYCNQTNLLHLPSRYGSYEWRLAVSAAPIGFGISLLVGVYTAYVKDILDSLQRWQIKVCNVFDSISLPTAPPAA